MPAACASCADCADCCCDCLRSAAQHCLNCACVDGEAVAAVEPVVSGFAAASPRAAIAVGAAVAVIVGAVTVPIVDVSSGVSVACDAEAAGADDVVAAESELVAADSLFGHPTSRTA